jgi:amidohydrolase
MIADGAMKGVDAVIALHVDGTLERGRVSVADGGIGAAVDRFEAHIIGQGGHGASPPEK